MIKFRLLKFVNIDECVLIIILVLLFKIVLYFNIICLFVWLWFKLIISFFLKIFLSDDLIELIIKFLGIMISICLFCEIILWIKWKKKGFNLVFWYWFI